MMTETNAKLTIESLMLIVEEQKRTIETLQKNLDYYNYKWKCTEDYRIEKSMDKLSHQKLKDALDCGDTEAYEEGLYTDTSELR